MTANQTQNEALQTILPVKPGSINDADRAALKEIGVLVIEHEVPESIRLITPLTETSQAEMLKLAVKALSSYKGVTADSMREYFARLVMDAIQKEVL